MMRKSFARKLMLAAAVAAAIPAFAEKTPMALPAHFVPTEADYNASVALPGFDGDTHQVELSQQGVYAYRQMAESSRALAFAR